MRLDKWRPTWSCGGEAAHVAFSLVLRVRSGVPWRPFVCSRVAWMVATLTPRRRRGTPFARATVVPPSVLLLRKHLVVELATGHQIALAQVTHDFSNSGDVALPVLTLGPTGSHSPRRIVLRFATVRPRGQPLRGRELGTERVGVLGKEPLRTIRRSSAHSAGS